MSTIKQLAAIWGTDFRYMTLWERCLVGWQLWRDDVQRWPLPACKTNPGLWLSIEEMCSHTHSYPKDEPDCRLCGCFGPIDDDGPCERPQWICTEMSNALPTAPMKNQRIQTSSGGTPSDV